MCVCENINILLNITFCILLCCLQSVYNAMGEALYRTGEASEAEQWFKEALKTKPDHIPAHLTYGKMLARNVSNTKLYTTFNTWRNA